ncbi:AraC family transcriptional regulator [Cupriavidus sp. 30B13]|uniref:AraC family transcriptional regulator n=1 Tax=Cupriavidus sp. 30B13 TaxID=3384241 RepID=UPI003B914C53
MHKTDTRRARLQTFGDELQHSQIIAKAMDYQDGAHEPAHFHHRAQLVCAMRGIVRVITPLGLWTLTEGSALLIGSQVEHALHMGGEVSLRTLYILPERLARPERECRAIPMGDLLRAAIAGMFGPELDDADGSREQLLVPLILRLLDGAPAHARDLRLPLPADWRLRTICEALIAQPDNNETLERWSERAHTSSRTLARLFRQETSMSFGQWREQLRLTEAMSRLLTGQPAPSVAEELGYASVRTFSVMFKRSFGCTPQRFQAGAPL